MNDSVDAPLREDRKDTLNLPKSDFPMKGNLAQLEPQLLQWWENREIYQKILTHNAGRPVFVLHAGHALNKILKISS